MVRDLNSKSSNIVNRYSITECHTSHRQGEFLPWS